MRLEIKLGLYRPVSR